MPLAMAALRTQWMPPTQSLEPREIAVRCDEFTAMFDCQRSQVSITHQWPINAIAQLQKEIPVCATRHDEDGSGPFNQPAAKCHGRWHRRCWPKDLWIGNDSQEASEHDLRDRERFGGLDAPSKPRGVPMVLWRVLPMRVDEDVDVRQLHSG
jgi:hypothetical protein